MHATDEEATQEIVAQSVEPIVAMTRPVRTCACVALSDLPAMVMNVEPVHESARVSGANAECFVGLKGTAQAGNSRGRTGSSRTCHGRIEAFCAHGLGRVICERILVTGNSCAQDADANPW